MCSSISSTVTIGAGFCVCSPCVDRGSRVQSRITERAWQLRPSSKKHSARRAVNSVLGLNLLSLSQWKRRGRNGSLNLSSQSHTMLSS